MSKGPGTKLLYIASVALIFVAVVMIFDIPYMFAVILANTGIMSVYLVICLVVTGLCLSAGLLGIRYGHNRYKSKLLFYFAVVLVAAATVKLLMLCWIHAFVTPVVPIVPIAELAAGVLYLIGACKNKIKVIDGTEDLEALEKENFA